MVKNIIVCGGRDYDDWGEFSRQMHWIAMAMFDRTPPSPDGNWLFDVTIHAGGAKGADSLAHNWAMNDNVAFSEYPAYWDKLGKRAGYERNERMLRLSNADLVIAFPGGKGTAMMIKLAQKAGVPVIDLKQLRNPELKTDKYRKAFIDAVGNHYGSMSLNDRQILFYRLLKEEMEYLKALEVVDEEYNEIMAAQDLFNQ